MRFPSGFTGLHFHAHRNDAGMPRDDQNAGPVETKRFTALPNRLYFVK